MLVLEEQEVPQDMIRRAIRKGTIDNVMVPVVCGTFLPQQGCSEAAGRHRGLYALSRGHSCHQGIDPIPRKRMSRQ